MPSFFETFGRVYFESMAMGIPIICARDSGISGFFREREEGISVDHRSIDQITDELEYLITQPAERQRIGLKGQELVKRYTWEQVAVDLHGKYEQSLPENI
ncbi:MAG: glycosyltransferase family 4 protein, partial [Bacteroidales bacterium]|nr:glycosyltransferase family 4 protein [Bacteroidales bacterium]